MDIYSKEALLLLVKDGVRNAECSIWGEEVVPLKNKLQPFQTVSRESLEDRLMDILLTRDSEALTYYLMEITLQAGRRYKDIKNLRRRELYIVPHETKKEAFTCFLGKDLRDPEISMPTYDQLIESYFWHQKYDQEADSYCRSQESWVRFRFSNALDSLSDAQRTRAPSCEFAKGTK